MQSGFKIQVLFYQTKYFTTNLSFFGSMQVPQVDHTSLPQ